MEINGFVIAVMSGYHFARHSSLAAGAFSHNRSVGSRIGISPPSTSSGAFVQIGSEYLTECLAAEMLRK